MNSNSNDKRFLWGEEMTGNKEEVVKNRNMIKQRNEMRKLENFMRFGGPRGCWKRVNRGEDEANGTKREINRRLPIGYPRYKATIPGKNITSIAARNRGSVVRICRITPFFRGIGRRPVKITAASCMKLFDFAILKILRQCGIEETDRMTLDTLRYVGEAYMIRLLKLLRLVQDAKPFVENCGLHDVIGKVLRIFGISLQNVFDSVKKYSRCRVTA